MADVNHFEASLHLANLMVQLGEGQRAAKYFSNCIRIHPDSIAAHFGLMTVVKREPNNEEVAIKHLKLILHDDPDNFYVST